MVRMLGIWGLCFPALVMGVLNPPADPIVFPGPVVWQARFQGIDYAEMVVTQPRPIHGHMVRVDLTEPSLAFVVTPDNGSLPGETDSLWTSRFLKKVDCQVAINANPFAPVHLAEGKPQDVIGLLVDDGEVISPQQDTLPALLIGADRRASIANPPFKLASVQHAVGGFSVVLENDRIVAQGEKRHPRTAAGVSRDGRVLYLLVIDGRQTGYSEGATTTDIAVWLKRLGASDGINLDGGGTSTLVMEQPDGTVSVINRPIHRGVPGLERPGGAHLGIRATALAPHELLVEPESFSH